MACQGDGIKTDIAGVVADSKNLNQKWDNDCYKITEFRKKSFLTQIIERLFRR